MPHCIIEYSKALESKTTAQTLVSNVYRAVLSSGLFKKPTDIKTRTVSYENCYTGEEQANFIHVSLRILSGRSEQQKQQLSSSVFEAIAALKLTQITLTVEVIDMDKETYQKQLF